MKNVKPIGNQSKLHDDYSSSYLLAIKRPLPALQKTFKSEFRFLSAYCKNKIVLDVGCGAGRPASKLSWLCKEITCIDNDYKMINIARERLKHIGNSKLTKGNATKLPFPNSLFDFVYATYNLLGSILPENREVVVREMARVCKPNGYIVNITWKRDLVTTNFLRQYYPSINIQIYEESDDDKTVTSHGIFYRLSKDVLRAYYFNNDLKNIRFVEIGPVWMAVIGQK